MKNRKSVLLITHELSNTGAPILCRRISEEFKKNGYKTVIISLCRGRVSEKVRQAAHEVRVVNIRHSYLKKVLRMINPKWGKEKSWRLGILLYYYKLRGFNKAIVNSIESGNIIPYLKKNNFKFITLVHEMESVYEKFNAYDKLDYISEHSDTIVFPAEAVKSEFLGAVSVNPTGKMLIRPQGYYKKETALTNKEIARKKISEKLGLEGDARFIIGSGAIDIIKGVDFVPLIMNRLKEYQNLHFLWLGEINKSPYMASVKAQIKKMGLEKRIHFMGYIDDSDLYNNILCGCDAFVLTSREDPMPSVMAEAIAMRIPVIAFKKSGGAEELLADGRGLLAEYGDINHMAEIISDVIDNKTDVQSITNVAYDHLKKNLVFEDYVAALEEILFEEE